MSIPCCADTVMRSFALRNTTWLWTRNTSPMFSVAWMEVMLLSADFAHSRGRRCAVANLEVSFRTLTYTAVAQEKSLFLFLTNVMGTLRACLCGGDVEGGWGGGKERGEERDWRERERCFLWGLLYWPVCGWEPETGPLLCRTALWDCFKDTDTSFIGSVFYFRKSKTAQKSVPYDTTPIS